MQNDLISRSALLAQLTGQEIKCPQLRYAEGFNDALKRFRGMVHKAPTVGVEPVVHAQWDVRSGEIVCAGKYGCYEAMRWLSYIKNDYFDNKLPEYCPHCGARMDAKEEDDAAD